MSQLVNYISQRGNSFHIENQGIQNLVTGTQFDKKAFQFLLNVVPIGESAYDGRPRFEKVDMRKNLCNFLTIFQRLEYQQRYRPKRKKSNILKETTALMRNIHSARFRDYSVATL